MSFEEVQLKGPDLDTFEVGPGGEKRPLPTRKEREQRFQAELNANPKLAGQIVDEYMDSTQESNRNYADSSNEPSTEELDHMMRAAYVLTREFPNALEQRVTAFGIRLRGMMPNGEGTGYKIYAEDREKHPFVVDMKHEDTNKAFSEWGESMGPALVDLIADRLFEAKKTYYTRAGLI